MYKKRDDIEITKIDDSTFKVTVNELETCSYHIVEVDDEYYQELTKGHITKMELIRISFRFLLQQEPKESILHTFSLNVIPKYFPEYEKRISI